MAQKKKRKLSSKNKHGNNLEKEISTIDNCINDYFITWRFSTFFENIDYVQSRLETLFKQKICSIAIDSGCYVYKLINDKLEYRQFELDCDYANPSGHINFNIEGIQFNKQDKHYIFETAGMLVHRNMMFNDLDSLNCISLVMEPIYIYINNMNLRLYPVAVIRDKILIIEYRVYAKDKMDSNEFIEYYSCMQHAKIEKLHVDVNLYKQLFPENELTELIEMEHDGLIQKVCEVKMSSSLYLKDISLSLVGIITNSEYFDWTGRVTYALDTKDKEENIVLPILLSSLEESNINKNDYVKNYREYNDYKHYVSAGATVAIGKDMEMYMFVDTLDQEICYVMSEVNQLKKRSELYDHDKEQDLIGIYEGLLMFKREYLKKYNHLLSIHKVMEDIWIELKVEELIDVIKELIELKLKKSQLSKDKHMNNVQLYLSIVAVLLSTSPLYEYIVYPVYVSLTTTDVEYISTKIEVILFILTAIIFMIVLWVLKKIFIRSNKKK